jgi:hypothetical protein
MVIHTAEGFVMRARGLLILGSFLACAAAAQTVTVDQPSCMPREANGLIHAALPASEAGRLLRLYFRWSDHEAFYWVQMEAEPGGRYWITPPKPDKRNDAIEYYAALVDPSGKVVARSESRKVKVADDCRVQLTPREQGVAENLTIGETAPEQVGKKVMGFLCDGVVTRVNAAGVRRADDICRACVVAWWQRKSVLIPAAGVIGVVVAGSPPEPEASTPRPPAL